MISCDARGLFIVENEDTFEQICKIPEITDTWLCVWGKGYATNGLVDLLRTLDGLPLVAWGDLGAHGIRIISNLADRVARPVTPVAMTVDLYRAGVKYAQSPEKLAGNRKLSIRLAQEALSCPARPGRRDRPDWRRRLRAGDPLRRSSARTPGSLEAVLLSGLG